MPRDNFFELLSSGARFSSKSSAKGEIADVVAAGPGDNDKNQGRGDRKKERKRAKAKASKASKKSKEREAHEEDVSLDHAEQEVRAFRRRMRIYVGDSCSVPHPLTTFSEISVPSGVPSAFKPVLVRNIESGKWVVPTAVQMQAVPTLLASRDSLVTAPTGSGKTGAFAIPCLAFSAVEPGPGQTGWSVKTAVVAPTRELAEQICREIRRLGADKPGGLRAYVLEKSNESGVRDGVLGGERGIDVLVGTPMRMSGVAGKLGGVRLLILDEADRLMDTADGKAQEDTFLSQIKEILKGVPSTAVRGLFSATMAPAVKELATTILRNPVNIAQGVNPSGAASANSDISQKLLFVGKESGKLLAMRQFIRKGFKPPCLVFVQDKHRARELYEELRHEGVRVDYISGDRSKKVRDLAVDKFRLSETWMMIATDVVSRGLDFKAVNTVVNYDFPSSGVNYVHRIGRTGRAGRKGVAVTFFVEADYPALRGIANIINLSGGDVEDWMLKMPKERRDEKKRRESWGIRRKDINTTPKSMRKRRRT